MDERREYFVAKDRGRYAVRYRYVMPGETRAGNADNLPEFPAMAGVRFLTEGKALQAAAALQLAYADGIAVGEGSNGAAG